MNVTMRILLAGALALFLAACSGGSSNNNNNSTLERERDEALEQVTDLTGSSAELQQRLTALEQGGRPEDATAIEDLKKRIMELEDAEQKRLDEIASGRARKAFDVLDALDIALAVAATPPTATNPHGIQGELTATRAPESPAKFKVTPAALQDYTWLLLAGSKLMRAWLPRSTGGPMGP